MAQDSSGIIAGMNPLKYSTTSPYTMFFFQLIVIITFSLVLNYPLSKIKQPRVIAEVLTGVILGHTALGRIPNFTKYVFPPESIPGLTLVANIGICLLMFIVGCEVDVKFIKKHIFTAVSVGLFNMAVPFGLGCLCAIGLWKEYRENADGLPQIKFTTFMVFIAVALCITAFPVLVRIITELRLVKDRVGTVVLAAGITNDLFGWVMLALSVTLANASDSLVTLYIVLVCFGWCLFICYPVRITLNWFLKNCLKEFDGSNEPSRPAMTLILVMVFASAFFTDIIGVHPIFGAFLIGAIVPRENNYVIGLTSRIEDLVNIIFVPVYFGIAGLSVDLGLLRSGADWGWAIGLIVIAMVGKISGGLIASKLRGLFWRESLTVGVLMSCKGIVEIVVLQVGLNANIITRKTYSMFIFMAIITTFLTTPLTLYAYPASYREKVQVWIQEAANEKLKKTAVNDKETILVEKEDIVIDKLILAVDDVDSLSTGMLIIDILLENAQIPIHAINMKTLTERTADILHASMMNEDENQHGYTSLNSTLSVFSIFCHYNRIPFTSEILYSLPENYLETLLDNSSFSDNNLFMLPMTKKNFSIQNIRDIIKESQHLNYYKGIFINNGQFLFTQNDHADMGTKEANGRFSEDTMLNPTALKISSVTLFLNHPELTKNDKLAMHLFEILVKGKDLSVGKVILDNIEPESRTNDIISSWIKDNDEIFGKIHFIITNKTNTLSKLDTGKSISAFLTDETKTFSELDRLIIVSADGNDINLISELVEKHEKVIVLF